MASSSAAPAIEVFSPPASPLKLPWEIVNRIADRYLPLRDCKSLRLACRFFEAPMLQPLFRRVVISRTKLDRDSFFNVAQSPVSAAAVRELVWYELAEDETVFFYVEEVADTNSKQNANITGPSSGNCASGHEPTRMPPLSQTARDAFWLTSNGSSADYRNKHPEKALEKLDGSSRGKTIDDFRTQFLSALGAMHNIHTFVPCPMPLWREVFKGDYSLIAGLLQTGVRHGWNERQANDGFFHFLLPAMHLTNLRVQRLAFADEGFKCSLYRLRPPISWFQATDAPTGLVYLRICMEKVARQADVGSLFGTNERRLWPHLRTLELTGVKLSGGCPLSSFLRLIKAHKSTSRHLRYDDSQVTYALIGGMARIVRSVSLESLRVDNKSSTDTPIVAEHHLLAYVNGTGPCPVNLSSDSAWDWNTVLTLFDPHHEPTAALLDAAGSGATLYWDADIATIFERIQREDLDDVRSNRSVYARAKRAKLKLKLNESNGNGNGNGNNSVSAIAERPVASRWLFNHPDGQEAIGDEPLEFSSDWEDSSDDERSADGAEAMSRAPSQGAAAVGGGSHVLSGDEGSSDDGDAGDDDTEDDDSDSDDGESWDGSSCSVFDGDDLVERMDAPSALLKGRYIAIPLLDLRT